MKKNMLTVLVVILCIVNITLSGYMVFTVVPNAERTDQLITKIMQIIDLELESPLPSDINVSYDIKDVEKYELDEITANLRAGVDGKSHYAIINSSLTINTVHEDYVELNPKVDIMKSDIVSIVISNIQKYTYDEINTVEVQQQIKEQTLADIQTLFNSKFIVDCTIRYLIQ